MNTKQYPTGGVALRGNSHKITVILIDIAIAIGEEMAAFHNRVGSLVGLSNERRTAQRRREAEEFADGTVFSAKPLRNDQLFEVQIDRKVVGKLHFH